MLESLRLSEGRAPSSLEGYAERSKLGEANAVMV